AGFDEPADVERSAELSHDPPEAKPRLARSRAAADARVQNDDARDPLGLLDGEPQPDRAAPVVHDERQVTEVERRRELRDRVDVPVVRVPADLLRLVRLAEADQIRR